MHHAWQPPSLCQRWTIVTPSLLVYTSARTRSRLFACQQMLADTTTWHRSWWTFTGCECHSASNTNCPRSCIVASTEQRHDTWLSWQRPSAALLVVACGRRHLPISSCSHSSFNSRRPRVRRCWPVEQSTSSATYNTFKKDLKSNFFGLSFWLWRVFWLCTALL